jgi:hypothetical protein
VKKEKGKKACGVMRAGLILERAHMPMTPFFLPGTLKNVLTVPAWYTDYFSHSNFQLLQKKYDFLSF